MNRIIKHILIFIIVIFSCNNTVKAETLNEYNYETLSNKALAEAEAGDYAEALYYYNKLVEESNGIYLNAAAYCLRGYFFLYNLLNFDKAIADANSAISIDSQSQPAYLLRSLSRAEKNDLDGAILDATRAIDIKPDDDLCYLIRSRLYLLNKNFELAIKDATTSIKLKCKNPSAFYYRGLAKYEISLRTYKKDKQKAINLLKSSLQDLSYSKEQSLQMHNIEQYNMSINLYNKAKRFMNIL